MNTTKNFVDLLNPNQTGEEADAAHDALVTLLQHFKGIPRRALEARIKDTSPDLIIDTENDPNPVDDDFDRGFELGATFAEMRMQRSSREPLRVYWFESQGIQAFYVTAAPIELVQLIVNKFYCL